jgi:hypothetical protein
MGAGFLHSGLLVGRQQVPCRLTLCVPGAYEYDCLVHPGTDGTITVLPTAE